MRNKLSRAREIFQKCQEHLSKTDSSEEIEFFLSQYILVVIFSEIQEKIYNIIEQKADAAGDIEIKNYMGNSIPRLLRSVGKNEISGFLKLFGEHVKTKFNDSLEEEDITIYSSLITQRHSIAHKQGAQVTFNDIKNFIEKSEKVIESVNNALNNPDT